MQSFEALEATWQARPRADPEGARVAVLVLRLGGGSHRVLPSIDITVDGGVIGDRWSAGAPGKPPDPESQVTVMSLAVARALFDPGVPDSALHLPGDNILVDRDLDEAALPAGTRLVLGDVILRVSAKPHAGCAKFSTRFGQDALRWVNTHEHRERRLRGINCRVVQGGTVRVGDRMTVQA